LITQFGHGFEVGKVFLNDHFYIVVR
jgi:hypothetical protein